MDELNRMKDARKKLRDAAAKGATKKAEVGTPASASSHSAKNTMPLRKKEDPKTANPYAGINTIPLRQRTEAESTNPYIRALAARQGTETMPLRSNENLYMKALNDAGTPVQSASAEPGGNIYAQANAQQTALQTADRDQARKAYQQALQRNMAAAAADPNSVTPEMQEELRRAEQAMRQADVGPEGRELAFGEKADYVGRNFVGGMLSSTANITNDWTNRAVMAEPIEAMTNTERLKWDPAKQEEIDRAYSEYLAGLTQDEKDYMEITGTMPSREEVYARKMEPEAQKAVDEVELKRWNTWDEPYNQKTQEMFQDAHIGEGLKLAGELAQTTGNQVPAMAVRMIPVVGPALSTTLFFSSAAGAATQEALEAGATNRQAMNYGDAVGIVEAATEKMFDGVSGLLGKGGADELTEVLVGRVAKSDVGRGILRWLAGSVGEGVEEVVSDLFNPLISTLYNGKTVKESYKDLDAGEIFHDYLLGMLSGGLLGSMSFVSGQSRNANQTLNNEAVREAIGKWKDTGTFKAFREAVGAVKSQTEMDNTARGIEKQWKKEAQKAGQDADAYIQERLNGKSMEEYARDTIREQEARKEKARELGMKEDQLDRLLFAYGMDSVEELEAMQKRMGDGVPAPPVIGSMTNENAPRASAASRAVICPTE